MIKSVKNNKIHYVIYTERESVLYHGIKTPRSVLKNDNNEKLHYYLCNVALVMCFCDVQHVEILYI